MGEALTIRVQEDDGYIVVAVGGEIDIAAVALLHEHLYAWAASGRPLIADLDQTSSIGPAGIEVLVRAAQRAAEHGGCLQVVCARPQIRRLFMLTGAGNQIPLTRTFGGGAASMLRAP